MWALRGDRKSPSLREKPPLQRRPDLKFVDGVLEGRFFVWPFDTAEKGGWRSL
jgi:hypothetical protein